MRESFSIAAFEKVRNKILKEVAELPADKRTVIPEGFNNNILWHLGHLITVADSLLFGVAGEGRKAPESYRKLFGNGTKPADWEGDVPAWDTIVDQLKQQVEDARSSLEGKFGNPVKENFAKAETVEEIFNFNINHENGHAGNINSMLKVLKRS
jgi:uncharacterized damage-inducible protein DinB